MPRGKFQRRALKERCGSKAFLMPGELKFPIMSYRGRCKPDCMGLLSAFRRGEQMADVAARAGRKAASRKYRVAAEKARRMAKSARCSWK